MCEGGWLFPPCNFPNGTPPTFVHALHCRDGIVNLDYYNLVCDLPEIAVKFKQAVNHLTFNLLHAHASPSVFFRKK